MQQPVILITGATDGIGLALARYYHQRGARLVLVGRRAPDTLDSALFTPASYCRVDLAQPYSARLVAQFCALQQIERLDLLIHNAAAGYYGPVEAQKPQHIRDLLALNLRAPIALTHTLLPYLPVERGKIVFIGSVVSALACPNYAVYGASKAALDGFVRSLRVEVRGRARVQLIQPGATRTGMHARSGMPLDQRRWERFPAPETIAARIAQAINTPHEKVVVGLGNRLLTVGGRHLAPLTDWLQRRYAQ